MLDKKEFEYTLSLIDSFPQNLADRSHLWRGLRAGLNQLLDPDNSNKVVEIAIGNTTSTTEASRAIESVRGAIYAWHYSAGIGKKGKRVQTVADKKDMNNVKMYVRLVDMPY